MLVIDSKGPVSQPPLNSVPSRPFVLRTARMTHARTTYGQPELLLFGLLHARSPSTGRFESSHPFEKPLLSKISHSVLETLIVDFHFGLKLST